MGRILPPGGLRRLAQLSGTADPPLQPANQLWCLRKVQKMVLIRSGVLHLLSSLAYKEVRVTTLAVWGCVSAW